MKDNLTFASNPFRQKGLTLIELVLVTGIIAALAGIIWAALAPLREKARQIQCMNNLKQIYLAFVMYRETYGYSVISPVKGVPLDPVDLGFPCIPARYPPPIAPDDMLEPFLKSKDVFKCPNDPTHWEHSYTTMVPPFCRYSEVENLPRDNFNWWIMDRFRRMTAECGERMPIFYCPWHGLEQRTDSYAIILRWGGVVEGRYIIEWPQTLCLD